VRSSVFCVSALLRVCPHLSALTQHCLPRQHADAVRHFSACIALDAQCEVYFSNRSAAHAAAGDWPAAAADAARTTQLKPGWPKGWARRGAAAMGLEEFTGKRARCMCSLLASLLRARLSALACSACCAADAKEAYAQAAELEPDNASYHAVRRCRC
jgi:hypothetical protein